MIKTVQRACIIGDGAMGTLCALLLAENGIDVSLWSHFADQAADLKRDRENKRFLPGHQLPNNVHPTADATEAFAGAELAVNAVPCQFIRKVWGGLVAQYPERCPVVSTAKGIEVDTLMVSTEILGDLLGDVPIVALSGPSIAPEVADRQPCTVVAASEDHAHAELVQRAFSNEYFRVYTKTDVIGVELAGATKNVIALAAGALDGLELGCNAKAALLTRGLVEITRLGIAMGADPETFRGLAGFGDLVTTCISPVGRNRSAGEKIGRGMGVKETIASTQSVIEGIPTTGSVLRLAAKYNVEMPITEAVGAVLSGEKTPRDAITQLMSRELKRE